MVQKSLIILSLLCCACSSAFTQTGQKGDVLISWDANTEGDLAGYKVYLGKSSRNYSVNLKLVIAEQANPDSFKNKPRFVWKDLNVGETYFFAVTAFDFSGNESAFSDEVSAIVRDTIPPAAPGNLKVVSIIILAGMGIIGIVFLVIFAIKRIDKDNG